MKILILDSNSLVTPNERRLVNRDTETEIKACRNIYPVQVFAPRVVLAEVAQRRVNQIVRDYAAAVRNVAVVAKLIGMEIPGSNLSETILRRKLYRLFLRWCRENEIQIERPPSHSIRWDRLIKDAIYRRAPFSAGESEKGFRDAIILETVAAIKERYSGAHITFVSRDGRLLEAAARRFSGSSVSLAETVAAYRSQLLLEFDEIIAKHIATFTTKAAERFYTAGDSASLFLKLNVIPAIQHNYREEIQKMPKLSSFEQLIYFPQELDSDRLRPIENAYAIGSTLYRGKRGGEKHEWQTRVVALTLFEAEPRFQGLVPEEFIREVTFDVDWSADVSADGNYNSEALNTVSLENSTLAHVSEKHRTLYSLPRVWERRTGQRLSEIINMSNENPWTSALLKSWK